MGVVVYVDTLLAEGVFTHSFENVILFLRDGYYVYF